MPDRYPTFRFVANDGNTYEKTSPIHQSPGFFFQGERFLSFTILTILQERRLIRLSRRYIIRRYRVCADLVRSFIYARSYNDLVETKDQTTAAFDSYDNVIGKALIVICRGLP